MIHIQRSLMLTALVGLSGVLLFSFNNCSGPTLNTKTMSAEKSISQQSAGGGSNSGTTSSNDTSLLNLKSYGTVDLNCLAGNTGVCLFYKNPLVSSYIQYNTSAFGSLYQRTGSSNALQAFRVILELPNATSLSNANFSVGTGTDVDGASISFNATSYNWNSLRLNVGQDTQHLVTQASTFFWLQTMIDEWNLRIGGSKQSNRFWATGKGMRVYASVTAASDSALMDYLYNNAFYQSSGNLLVLGKQMNSSGAEAYPIAFSSEVILHEMGHANHFHSQSNSIEISDTNSTDYLGNYFCKTYDGCYDAISEGIADFHFLMMFGDLPTGNETGTNSLHPSKGSWRFRDQSSDFVKSSTIPSLYTASTLVFTDNTSKAGEIHYMGGAFASILWKIYSNPATNKRAFEKTFAVFLQQITGNTLFSDTKTLLISIDQANHNSVNRSIILSAYSGKGL